MGGTGVHQGAPGVEHSLKFIPEGWKRFPLTAVLNGFARLEGGVAGAPEASGLFRLGTKI